MGNRLTEGAAYVGDILLDRGKLDKSIKLRIGSGVGGTPISGSSEVTCVGPEAVLPAQALVYDVFVNVLVASTGATKTFSVGLLSTSSGGNRTGFLNGVSSATTGIQRGLVTNGTSGPGTGGMFYVSNTFGGFLSTFTSGSTAAGDPGYFNQKTYPTDTNTAKTVSYTPNSTDWIAFAADLYICYVDLTK